MRTSSKEYEHVFIDNICNNCIYGMVISWAIKDQGGKGHFNEQNNDYIIDKIESKGFSYDIKSSEILRNASSLWWFKKTIMVFRKIPLPLSNVNTTSTLSNVNTTSTLSNVNTIIKTHDNTFEHEIAESVYETFLETIKEPIDSKKIFHIPDGNKLGICLIEFRRKHC